MSTRSAQPASGFKPLFPGHRQTCYFCDNVWGECVCDRPETAVDDPNAPGFSYEEFWITDPSVSVCARFFVDPIAYYGEAYTNSDVSKEKK